MVNASSESRGSTSHSTLYRSFRGLFLQVRWPNQQRQSTEGSQLATEIGFSPTRITPPRYNMNCRQSFYAKHSVRVVTKTQSAGPISCLEHRTTRVLHCSIVTRVAVLLFALLLQTNINQMRPHRLRRTTLQKNLQSIIHSYKITENCIKHVNNRSNVKYQRMFWD